ncbi:DUF2955 domain-containing protein [Dyella soli]|nr:DUF2955 domain-containing protein [Dyella soli]
MSTRSHRQGGPALHAALRFAVGVTGAFVACEVLQWTPTFLAPVLAAALLANLPARPSLKITLVLVLTMTAVSLFAFVISQLLHDTPTLLLGLIGLCMLLAFHAMAQRRARLPALLLLICLATIPVVAMIAPAQVDILPTALVRGIALALLMIWIVHVPWPRTAVPASAPQVAADPAGPLALALVSTAIVLPLMLVYLLLGLADALPVLVATVMLVANFDPQRSRMHALGMVVGNIAGGMLGLFVYTLVAFIPTLPFFALLLFLVLFGFGQRIAAGGPTAVVALIACNTMLIILGSALASGPGSSLLWLTRLSQFVLAGVFAVSMLNLLWHRVAPATATTR